MSGAAAGQLRPQEADRREEILTAARTLFGRYGIDRVSLRDIAGELGMSVGNLTYYFPRKTALVDAVLEDLGRDPLSGGRPPRDLRELDEFLRRCERLLWESALFFRPCSPRGTDSRLRGIQAGAVRALGALWDAILANLREAELMAAPDYPGQHQAVSLAIQQNFRYWALCARAEGETAPGLRACVWAILYPNLTERGRRLARALEAIPCPRSS